MFNEDAGLNFVFPHSQPTREGAIAFNRYDKKNTFLTFFVTFLSFLLQIPI